MTKKAATPTPAKRQHHDPAVTARNKERRIMKQLKEQQRKAAVEHGKARAERRAALQQIDEKNKEILEHRDDKHWLLSHELGHLIRRAA